MMFDATVKEYLHEIDEVKLLNWQQECELAKAVIEHNDFEAREHLVRSNLRLVVNIAKKFSNKGLSLGDLIEEGNLGLLRAVDSFDPSHGVRFGTYASWWIKQGIKRALLLDSGPVHIPTYMMELIKHYRRVVAGIEGTVLHQPNLKEIAAKMKLPVRKVKAIKEIVDATSTGSHIDSSEPNQGIEDVLADATVSAPDDVLINAEEQQRAMQLLSEIDSREAEVLTLRFGLTGKEPLTLKEIGDKLGLTRERVRQIQRNALTKLHELMTE